MPRRQLADPRIVLAFTDLADLQAKTAQQPANAELDVAELDLQQFPSGKQRPYLLRRHCLDMHWTEPAHSDQLRHAARVVAIGLHFHRAQRRPEVPRLDQDRGKPRASRIIFPVPSTTHTLLCSNDTSITAK